MKIAMLGLKGVPCPGGVETVVEEIGSRLAQRGHEVIVYVRPHYTPRSLKEYRGMRLVNLPSIPTKNFDAITHSFLATCASLGEKPDVVHIHSTGNSIYAGLPRAFGIPTVVTSHGLDWQRAKWGKFARAYLKFTDYTTTSLPNAATAVSRKMQRYYQEKYRRPVTYIPNGANTVQPKMPEEILKLGLTGGDYIFFASRLVPEKGCHYLLEAYRSIRRPGRKLVIAGDGSYGDAYAAELKKFAGEEILFLGFIKGRLLEELLSNAYFYVLPSEIEGLSAGLIEAMSYGNCVLVSDIEENLEVVGDGGVTFQSRNVDDLREKIELLIRDESLVGSYREKARKIACDRFNWERVTDQYERLYTDLK